MQRFNLCIIVIELLTSACTKDAKSRDVDKQCYRSKVTRCTAKKSFLNYRNAAL